MRHQKQKITNFSRSLRTSSEVIRPDNEEELQQACLETSDYGLLARGQGLSYSDCSLNHQGCLIDTRRINQFLRFDPQTGLVICQPAVRFFELFLLHSNFIPAVIPGTVNTTLGGAIANDIHGKNHSIAGSFAHHLESFSLQTGSCLRNCSPTENPELFYASIGGLGLTGVITQLALRLKPAPAQVEVQSMAFDNFSQVLKQMKNEQFNLDHQIAWLDLLNSSQTALLFQAKTCSHSLPATPVNTWSVPNCPIPLIYRWSMKYFNQWYFRQQQKTERYQSLIEFNNPLDKIQHWNRLYGRKGFLQFQGVFSENQAEVALADLLEIIKAQKATATLAVLKILGKPSLGWLSFCQPGFTIAIDFIHNHQARKAIRAMNQYLCETGGRVYLAKDLLLTQDQFRQMYPRYQAFSELLSDYKSPMRSDLGRRLGLVK